MVEGWYNTNWSYRKPIIVKNSMISGTLCSYPAYIYISGDSHLSQYAQSSGRDILFTDYDGDTKLPHEIEYYSSGTLHAWVRIPYLYEDEDYKNKIFMYYGNPSATDQQQPSGVWDPNYVFVDHAKDSGSIVWSPIHHKYAVFKGSGSYIKISSIPELGDNPYNIDLTLTLWYQPFKLSGNQSLFADFCQELGFRIENDNTLWASFHNQLQTSEVEHNYGWHHLALVGRIGVNNRPGSGNIEVYKDGNLIYSAGFITGAASPGFNDPPFYIGADRCHSDRYFSGAIMDVRLYSGAKTAHEIRQIMAGIPITSNMIAWWKLDGNANDSYGSHDGEVHDIEWVDLQPSGLKRGYFLSFANDAYVDCGASSDVNPRENLTVSLWIKGNLSDNQTGEYIYPIARGTTWAIMVCQSTGTPIFKGLVRNSADTGYNEYGVDINVLDGKWHHLVMTYDGHYIRLYKDGYSVGTSSDFDDPMPVKSTNLYIGTYSPSYGHFTGYIDDVRIYNTVLSGIDIRSMFAPRREGPGIRPVVRYRFSEGSGDWIYTDNYSYYYGMSRYTALVLNGTDNYIEIKNSDDGNFDFSGYNSDWAILARVKIERNQNYDATIVRKYDGSDGYHLYLDSSNGKIKFHYTTTGTDLDLTTDNSYMDGNYHDIVIFYDNDENTAYLITEGGTEWGGETVSGSVNGSFVDSNTLMTFGGYSASNYISGAIERIISISGNWSIKNTEDWHNINYISYSVLNTFWDFSDGQGSWTFPYFSSIYSGQIFGTAEWKNPLISGNFNGDVSWVSKPSLCDSGKTAKYFNFGGVSAYRIPYNSVLASKAFPRSSMHATYEFLATQHITGNLWYNTQPIGWDWNDPEGIQIYRSTREVLTGIRTAQGAIGYNSNTILGDSWTYIAHVIDYSSNKLYQYTNGALVKTHNIDIAGDRYSSYSISIGGVKSEEINFWGGHKGDLDEIRVSIAPRPKNWIYTTYLNLFYPQSFIDAKSYQTLETSGIYGAGSVKLIYSGSSYFMFYPTRWDEDNWSVVVETFLSDVHRDLLFANVVPGAVRELYNYLGLPIFIDTTFNSGNTLTIVPISPSISGLRKTRRIAVKSISDTFINPSTYKVKIEGLRLDTEDLI